MKKSKFLNGISAMFAFAVVALGTTFTSCEKEDFNINVDLAEAQAYVSVSVSYVKNGKTTDVTNAATTEVTPYKTATLTGSQVSVAQTVTFTASYVNEQGKTLTGSVDWTIPALVKGQYASINPVITLYAADEQIQGEEPAEDEYVPTPTEEPVTGYKNETGLDETISISYVEKSGTYIDPSSIVWVANDLTSVQKQNVLDYIDGLNKARYTETTKSQDVNVPAGYEVVPTVKYNASKGTYEIYLVEGEVATKAVAGGRKVATADIIKYESTVFSYELVVTDHGHGSITHGHGGDASGGTASAD